MPTVEPDDEPSEDIDWLNEQDRLREKFVKLELDHQRQKEWHEWNKLPEWKKYDDQDNWAGDEFNAWA